nr:ribonuclease P protein component [Arenicella chitinivorans]
MKKPAEFHHVYQNKQWGNSRLFSFNVVARPASVATARLGVTVSKKVSKSAVSRNQIKRLIKEFYRINQHDLMAVDLVITAKPPCANASQLERWSDLQALWGKLLGWQRWHRRQIQ